MKTIIRKKQLKGIIGGQNNVTEGSVTNTSHEMEGRG